MSADPLSPTLPGVGVNRYAYAGNSPVTRLDPSGLYWDNDGERRKLDGERGRHGVANDGRYSVGLREFVESGSYNGRAIPTESPLDLIGLGKVAVKFTIGGIKLGFQTVGPIVDDAYQATVSGLKSAGAALQDAYQAARGMVDDVVDDATKLGKNPADQVLSATKKTPNPAVKDAYQRPTGATTAAQRQAVQGQPCVDCGTITSKQYANHKKALVEEHYETGTIDKVKMKEIESVNAHCPSCSAKQGAVLSQYSKEMKKLHDFDERY
jgi:hypothetical protein